MKKPNKKILELASKLLDEVERQGYDIANHDNNDLKSLYIWHHNCGTLSVEHFNGFAAKGTKKYGGNKA